MSESTATSTRSRLGELLDAEFLVRLDALDVISRRVLRSRLQGERRSKRRGQSVEFADHRPYVAGDDLRFIDWNIYGRLEQLFLKLFLEEQDLTIHLLVDVSGSVDYGEPSKWAFLRKLAAALGYVGLAHNNRVTLSCFADGLVAQRANLRGRRDVHHLTDVLLGSDAAGPTEFEKACRQAVASRAGTGVMVVLSDFLFKEGYESGLRRLISRQYELYAIQVFSPQELDPQLAGDLKLRDMEDDDEAEVTVSNALMKYYRRNVAAFREELRGFCTQRGATCVTVSSADPVERLVLTYLRRIGLLG
jgi:uncharacterized protein (DUF58 family)